MKNEQRKTVIIFLIKALWLHGLPWLFFVISPYRQVFYKVSSVWTEVINNFAGWSTYICSYLRVHRKWSLISSSLLHQQCSACLTGVVCEWTYNCYFVRVLLPGFVQNNPAAPLGSSHLFLTPCISLKFKWCNYIVVMTQLKGMNLDYGYEMNRCRFYFEIW